MAACLATLMLYCEWHWNLADRFELIQRLQVALAQIRAFLGQRRYHFRMEHLLFFSDIAIFV